MRLCTEKQAWIIPKNTPYAVLVESDRSVVVQASRLDVSWSEHELMTTIAY